MATQDLARFASGVYKVPLKSVALAVALALAACASYEPIIDIDGVDMSIYRSDLGACQQYADRISPAGGALAGGAIGAGVGAVFGGIVGAFLGDASEGIAFGAAIGGAQGVVEGGAGALERQISVIDNCMRQRGYKVL